MKLKFSKAGSTMSDENTPYNVLFDKECTVREIIATISAQNPNEWGEIQLRSKTYVDEWRLDYFRGYPYIEYRRGVVLQTDIFDKYMDACVEKVDACGGWGRMDYYIYIK